MRTESSNQQRLYATLISAQGIAIQRGVYRFVTVSEHLLTVCRRPVDRHICNFSAEIRLSNDPLHWIYYGFTLHTTCILLTILDTCAFSPR